MTSMWLAIIAVIILFKDCGGNYDYRSYLDSISNKINKLCNEVSMLRQELEWHRRGDGKGNEH